MPKLIFKLAVSIIVFAIVLSRINIGAVGQAIGGADILFLILALILALAMVVTDAAFWQSVLGSLGHRISFGTALLYCIVGSFFGGFGLSWTGVDIFRAAQLRQSGIPTETAIRAVVTARLVSLTSLLAVIACGLPIVLGYPLQPHDKVLLISFVVIGIGGLVAIVILGLAHNRFPLVELPTFLRQGCWCFKRFFQGSFEQAPLADQSAIFDIDSSAAGFDLCCNCRCAPRRSQLCGSLCPCPNFSSGRHGADRIGKLGRARSQRNILFGIGRRASGNGAQHLRHVRDTRTHY